MIEKEAWQTEPHLSACHLETPELLRLARALSYAFGSLLREHAEGTTEADNMPAIISWAAANKTHWSIGRNLLVTVRHELHANRQAIKPREGPGAGLSLLTFIDPPDTLRNDPHPESVSNEQAIRAAIKAAGWLTVIPKPKPKFNVAPVRAATIPGTPTPAPQAPRKVALVFKRGRED